MENFSTGISESMQHVSESMFRGLSLIVGTSQQVAIRRETNDIEEMVSRQIGVNGLSTMLSGSRREGFRLKGSDFDVMVWPNEIRVATDVSQSVYYDDSFNTVLLLSDSSESPPGFTLLQLMIPTEAADLNRDFPLFEKMHGNFYISCSFYKKWLREVSLSTPHILTEHGPCGNAIIYGTEWDLAPCFVCDFWPPSASSWIERCHSWPDPDIVDDIVRGGCHFVAIGHPLGQHEHLEWRISFSQAEQKCVYAMNHSQFLTYGLLKLFLKEVINQQHQETNELLCSYHMKTAVLWAIQQNTLTHWCPQNLLVGFWTCFKLLIKWVYEGFCPNFFIPKNNLFLSKIYGSSQKSLFLQMHELYRKGFGCLLQCSSISSCIIDVMYNPRLSILIDENVMCCEADYDKELLNAINLLNISMEKLPRALWIVEQLIGSHLTQYQVDHLQRLSVIFLQNTAATVLHAINSKSCVKNKQMYIADKISFQLLKLSVKFGCVSDMLYIAMFYYKTYRYRKALSVLEKTKAKLARPYLMYGEHVDRELYLEAVGGKSWATKKREAVAYDLIIYSRINYIDELVPLQEFARQSSIVFFDIPLFVFLHFLEFLCYRHIDGALSQAALNELQVLVQYGHNPYVPNTHRDISLYTYILGICQQMAGQH